MKVGVFLLEKQTYLKYHGMMHFLSHRKTVQKKKDISSKMIDSKKTLHYFRKVKILILMKKRCKKTNKSEMNMYEVSRDCPLIVGLKLDAI